MSLAQDYVLAVGSNPGRASEIATATATAIVSGKITLLEAVRSVELFINHEDATVRTKALKYLASILQGFQDDYLTRQQILTLTEFFCARLAESGSIDALNYLQGLNRFNKEMATITMKALAESFSDLQLLPQSRRLEVYWLIDLLMRNHRKALKEMGDKSLDIVINISANEKDPRNLMVVFSIFHVLIAEWDIVRCTEMLFESVFCYFPITFRPPPNDPYGITAEDLKDRLRICISSSVHFAPLAVPQLLDKLDSTSASVKNDVLLTIRACVTSFDARTVAAYSVALWDALKFEVLTEQSGELAAEALLTIRAIASKLDSVEPSSEPDKPNALLGFLRIITKEAIDHFEEPDQKQAQSMSRILRAVGEASPSSFSIIAGDVLPRIMDLYGGTTNISRRKGLLAIFLSVLESGQSFQQHPILSNLTVDAPASFKDRVFAIMSQALMGTDRSELSFRLLALKCLQISSSYVKFFSDAEMGLVVQYLSDLLLESGTKDRDELTAAAADALQEISGIYHHHILEITLPYLLARLPAPQEAYRNDHLNVLDALSKIGASRNVLDTVVRRLFNRLDSAWHSPNSEEYAKALLLTLDSILRQADPDLSTYSPEYMQRVSLLIRREVSLARTQDSPWPESQISNIGLLGSISCTIIKSLTSLDQQPVGHQVYNLYSPDPVFVSLEQSLDFKQAEKLTILLSTSLLAGLDRSVVLPYSKQGLTDVANKLTDLIIEELDPVVRHALHQHLCLLVNKFVESSDLEKVNIARWLTGKRSGLNFVVDKNFIQACFWVAKSLTSRLFMVDRILSSLLELLKEPKLGALASQGFAVLLAKDAIVNPQNGANIRLLLRQKLISTAVPRLVSLFAEAESNVKANCLVAISSLVSNSPNDITLFDVGTIIPLLLQSLDLSDQSVRLATLRTILTALNEYPDTIADYLTSLLTRLEHTLRHNNVEDTELRLMCLQCLQIIPTKFPRSKVMTCQTIAFRMISLAIDDPKRRVRKEAVDCRRSWLNIDEVESHEE